MSDIVNNLFDFIASKNLDKEKSLKGIAKKPVDLSKKSREIDKMTPSELFISVRNYAGEYIQQIMKTKENCHWIKSEMTRPFFDHFNFRYENQVFSILIDIVDFNNNSLIPPEFIKRQLGESKKNNLIPCTFRVKVADMSEPIYETVEDGWNLIHTETKNEIIPEELISDKKVLMSEWELHNFALMQMRYIMKQSNIEIMSFQDIIGVDPQLWYRDENGNQCWVVIRHYTDEKKIEKPKDLTEITRRCFKFSGYFAGFVFSSNTGGKKIYRGDSIGVRFLGLEKIHTFM